MVEMVRVHLDDGSLFVPKEYVSAIGEEYDSRRGLTVSQAQICIEKWRTLDRNTA
jgi:hypothetical protein